MEMGTAESRYDKISDFHTECQGLFGHLLCAVQLSGLSGTHGKSTCTHYFRQHSHGSAVNPHRRVFKGGVRTKEQLAMRDTSWIHFVLIPTDDWPIIANKTSCWDIMLSSPWTVNVRFQPPFEFEDRCLSAALTFNNHSGRNPSVRRHADLFLNWQEP